jgi:hypothetical protein
VGEVRLRAGGKGAGLLVADMDPFDGAALQVLGKEIERIAYDAVAALDARLLEDFDDDLCDFRTRFYLRFEGGSGEDGPTADGRWPRSSLARCVDDKSRARVCPSSWRVGWVHTLV